MCPSSDEHHWWPTSTYPWQSTAWSSWGLYVGTPFSSSAGNMVAGLLPTSFEVNCGPNFLGPMKCERDCPVPFSSKALGANAGRHLPLSCQSGKCMRKWNFRQHLSLRDYNEQGTHLPQAAHVAGGGNECLVDHLFWQHMEPVLISTQTPMSKRNISSSYIFSTLFICLLGHCASLVFLHSHWVFIFSFLQVYWILLPFCPANAEMHQGSLQSFLTAVISSHTRSLGESHLVPQKLIRICLEIDPHYQTRIMNYLLIVSIMMSPGPLYISDTQQKFCTPSKSSPSHSYTIEVLGPRSLNSWFCYFYRLSQVLAQSTVGLVGSNSKMLAKWDPWLPLQVLSSEPHPSI